MGVLKRFCKVIQLRGGPAYLPAIAGILKAFGYITSRVTDPVSDHLWVATRSAELTIALVKMTGSIVTSVIAFTVSQPYISTGRSTDVHTVAAIQVALWGVALSVTDAVA